MHYFAEIFSMDLSTDFSIYGSVYYQLWECQDENSKLEPGLTAVQTGLAQY
jgi:hypothetical protein